MKRKCRPGVVLAETALVLGLLLLITLGAIEYGWLFINMERITNAARHGARLEAAADAVPDHARDAMVALLSDMPTAVCTVSTAAGMVEATVSVPTNDVRLIHWDRLPAPANLQATVRMAKEAG